MTKNLIISAICATALSASVAAADTTITSSFNSFTLETGGVTYTGAYAATVTSEFDISDRFYAELAGSYIAASGVDAFALDASAGYLFRNDLNVRSGTGARMGAGVSLGGVVEFFGSTAISPDLVADIAIGTPFNDFGSVLAYDVGVEYVPWGLYANYMSASFTGYDVTLNGFGIGYRQRF